MNIGNKIHFKYIKQNKNKNKRVLYKSTIFNFLFKRTLKK